MNNRIFLRALEKEDVILLHKWRQNESITQYLSANKHFISLEREIISLEKKILDDSQHLYLGVCLKENKKLIGYVQINNIDLRNQKAEWGGTLIGENEHIGVGLGEEATRLLLDHLFNQYPINKCYTSCLAEHPATSKLFIKLGFQKEGLLRDEIYKNGEFKDLLVYSLLRTEYKNLRMESAIE